MTDEKISALNPKLNSDTGFLKIVAIVTLLIDHIGYLYFPQYVIMRVIGRISFPLFAYCLVLGSLYSKNIGKYCVRLLIFALVSEPFYLYAFYGISPSLLFRGFLMSETPLDFFRFVLELNIGFTLLLGLIAIYGFRSGKYWLSLGALVFAYFFPVEYGAFGVGLILLMYLLLKTPLYVFAPVLGAFLWIAPLCSSGHFTLLGMRLATQSFGILALLFILIKTNTKLRIPRWFNYGFYPAHLAVFCLIALLLN